MILQVYAVFDKAVGAYLPPFYTRSKGEALRSFSDACNDGKSNFTRYPNDYTLFHLGVYDDAGGNFQTFDPVRVISAVECLAPSAEVIERQREDRSTFAAQ